MCVFNTQLNQSSIYIVCVCVCVCILGYIIIILLFIFNFQYGLALKFITPLFFAHAERTTSCLEVGTKINHFDLRNIWRCDAHQVKKCEC